MTLGRNSSGRDLRVRFLWLAGTFFLGLGVLGIKLYRLQVTEYDEYAAKSVQNFLKPVRMRADRGAIRDEKGEILVQNRPSFDLFVTPAFCEECLARVIPSLAQWLGWTSDQITEATAKFRGAKRTKPFEAVRLRGDMGRDELDVVNAHLYDLPGVTVEPVNHREYKDGFVLAHMLGYMNEITADELEAKTGSTYSLGDYVGRRGIEREFEAKLRGEDGYRTQVVNARGETLRDLDELLNKDTFVAPHAGNNLVLSIDMRLQREAELAFPGLAGAVIAVDVRTGYIKAIVSRPSFDPNALTGRVSPAELAAMNRDPLQPLLYRPTQQHYSPGSTFKMVSALAALKSGRFTPHSVNTCNGGYQLGGRVWRCDLARGHGTIDLRVALQRSCNVYFYHVADVLGLDPIAEMGRSLGLGALTGIDVVGEVHGIMPDSRYYEHVAGGYTKGKALNSAIGQGDDNVTPLQLAMAYAAVANGGTLYQPQIVRRVESPEGRVLQEFQPKVVRNLELNPEHRRVVMDALTAVVNEPGGTGGAARLKDVTVAGKTGTAQVARIGAVRVKTAQLPYFARDNAWFAAIAPAEDPEIVVVVINEHAGFGAAGAAPVAGRVLRKYFDLKASDAGPPRLGVHVDNDGIGEADAHLPPQPTAFSSHDAP